jgi:ferrochelatase
VTKGEKTAVVLFNLGGPDSLDAVKPFLFNLFYDPAIIPVSKPFRWLLAKVISSRRASVAREIYSRIGGSSPLLKNTEEQAAALSAILNDGSDAGEFRCFIAMRYWHPRASETAAAVKAYGPDRIVLLPLYPQFSGTTSGSSLNEWLDEARKIGLEAPSRGVCCYPRDPGLADAVARGVGAAITEATIDGVAPRVLFSAHGLPKKIVDAGDPYQWQVEQSVSAVVERLNVPGLDWQICYQSRVGKLEWLRPYTEDVLRQAGTEKRAIVMVPIAFTSEHSETLVELDIEYRELATECGVPRYVRVGTVRADGAFIAGLAGAVRRAVGSGSPLVSGEGPRLCPDVHGRCAFSV